MCVCVCERGREREREREREMREKLYARIFPRARKLCPSSWSESVRKHQNAKITKFISKEEFYPGTILGRLGKNTKAPKRWISKMTSSVTLFLVST